MSMNETLIKSDCDTREYRTIELQNGIRAILVSDVENLVSLNENTNELVDEEENESSDSNDEGASEDEEDSSQPGEKMAACALCISVGSFSDPPHIQGLAHFLEHMVFMGSVKYPKENALDDFLSVRGGSDNATTDFEYTTFNIECREIHLADGMDLFAQFFISPLLIREAMTREREAIDSEFELALPSDGSRLEQLLGTLAPKDHPARCFPWGNKVSLQELIDDDNLHRAVRDFWLRHYSANRMTLAVVARLPLDTLEKYVRDSFSDVPNRNLPPTDFTPFRNLPWGPDFNCLLLIDPVYDLCEVVMTWILPPCCSEYESKPVGFLSSLLGHEGEGSLVSFLKKKSLGMHILSGNDGSGFEFNSMYSVLVIKVKLTEEGLLRVDLVLSAVFSYLAMLKENLPNERYFNEISLLASSRFKHRDEKEAVLYAEELAENMHYYRPEHYIAGDKLFFKHDPDLILTYLKNLTDVNVNITIHCKNRPNIPYDKEEPWFKTKYRMEPIPEEWRDSWLSAKALPDFFLPKVNPYITSRFSILSYDKDNVQAYPKKVLETPLLELWYKQDTTFKRPFASLRLYLISPIAQANPLNATLLRTFCKFVELKLEEKLYPSQEAGYRWRCIVEEFGIKINFRGYDEHLGMLYEEVLSGIRNIVDTLVNASNEKLFDAIKRDMEQIYYNSIIEASELNGKIRHLLLMKTYWSEIDCLGELKNVTLEKLQKYCLEFLSSCRCIMLMQGNISEATAIEYAFRPQEILKITPYTDNLEALVWNIEPGKEVICRIPSFNSDDNNASITNYYQLGRNGPFARESSILSIINLLINEPLFNSLRTQQQVGYNVSSEGLSTFGILGYTITVDYQGNKFTPDEINKKIEDFLSEFSDKLRNLTPDEFNEAKENVIALKRIVFNSLKEEVAHNILEIISREYMFDRLEKEAKELSSITHAELNDLYEALTLKNKKKLSIQITQGGPQFREKGDFALKPICPDPSCYISDITKFLQGRDFYPPQEVPS